MREGDFYGAKETLLASGGKSYVQYTGNGCVYYPGRKSNRISHAAHEVSSPIQPTSPVEAMSTPSTGSAFCRRLNENWLALIPT